MRTSSRGVIVASSSSLFVQPSLPLLPRIHHPSSAPPSYYLRRHHCYNSSTSSSSASLVVSAAARRMSMSTPSIDTHQPQPQSSSSSSLRVRIVSYNLLSSKLASPSHFTHTHPDHLQAENRLPLILSKLEKEMTRGFDTSTTNTTTNNDGDDGAHPPPPTIFALQEVCYPFASALHTFFASRGYHFVTGLYGRPFNGYMGVGIAYPLKDFETVNVDICRLSDTRPGGWPREEEEKKEQESGSVDGTTQRRGTIGYSIQRFVATFIQSITNRVSMKRLGGASSSSPSSADEKKPIDPWEMSENRFNVLLTTVLRLRSEGNGECSNTNMNSKNDNSAFLISNYHMPCAYFAPAVMNIHSDMVAKRVQDLAAEAWSSIQKSRGNDEDYSNDKVMPHREQEQERQRQPKQTIPYILAGDFNILPDSAQYNVLTTGMLDASDPTFPPPKHGMEWKVESLPMISAYAAFESEPEFTNYAHLKDDSDPFIGTLDYIFLSKNCSGESISRKHEWKVRGVQKLPSKEVSGGPFPSETEPSDHLLIAADLELVSML